jgi:hypothetical protein
MSLRSAFTLVRQCRSFAYPNSRFWMYLIELERDCLGLSSVSLSALEMHVDCEICEEVDEEDSEYLKLADNFAAISDKFALAQQECKQKENDSCVMFASEFGIATENIATAEEKPDMEINGIGTGTWESGTGNFSGYGGF